MCFDNKRNYRKTKNHNSETYELRRFCTLNGYLISGVANKLLKKFINDFEPQKIISFADRRWTPNANNNLYTFLGFRLENIIKPDYGYYYGRSHRSCRENKFKYGKQKIKEKFPDIYDEDKTEWEMMQEAGFDRIWDCGKFKYILEF
jgi:hypothetical protein